jgi:hypothetical protein
MRGYTNFSVLWTCYKLAASRAHSCLATCCAGATLPLHLVFLCISTTRKFRSPPPRTEDTTSLSAHPSSLSISKFQTCCNYTAFASEFSVPMHRILMDTNITIHILQATCFGTLKPSACITLYTFTMFQYTQSMTQ